MRAMRNLLLLTLTPPMTIGAVLWVMFTHVGRATDTPGYPVGFMTLAVGLTFAVSLMSAVCDYVEHAPHTRHTGEAVVPEVVEAEPVGYRRVPPGSTTEFVPEVLLAHLQRDHAARIVMSAPTEGGYWVTLAPRVESRRVGPNPFTVNDPYN